MAQVNISVPKEKTRKQSDQYCQGKSCAFIYSILARDGKMWAPEGVGGFTPQPHRLQPTDRLSWTDSTQILKLPLRMFLTSLTSSGLHYTPSFIPALHTLPSRNSQLLLQNLGGSLPDAAGLVFCKPIKMASYGQH